ncbi:hypothetical protein LV779_13900 [Streptomyces thinghirensis]|nr:hypothetical protein [Streptomyces thinghirensis]
MEALGEPDPMSHGLDVDGGLPVGDRDPDRYRVIAFPVNAADYGARRCETAWSSSPSGPTWASTSSGTSPTRSGPIPLAGRPLPFHAGRILLGPP